MRILAAVENDFVEKSKKLYSKKSTDKQRHKSYSLMGCWIFTIIFQIINDFFQFVDY